jgi:hypothetical protein
MRGFGNEKNPKPDSKTAFYPLLMLTLAFRLDYGKHLIIWQSY